MSMKVYRFRGFDRSNYEFCVKARSLSKAQAAARRRAAFVGMQCANLFLAEGAA